MFGRFGTRAVHIQLLFRAHVPTMRRCRLCIAGKNRRVWLQLLANIPSPTLTEIYSDSERTVPAAPAPGENVHTYRLSPWLHTYLPIEIRFHIVAYYNVFISPNGSDCDSGQNALEAPVSASGCCQCPTPIEVDMALFKCSSYYCYAELQRGIERRKLILVRYKVPSKIHFVCRTLLDPIWPYHTCIWLSCITDTSFGAAYIP